MDRRQREILALLPQGSTLRMVGGGHLEIVMPDGRTLRAPNGMPVRAAGSPSDQRAVKNLRAQIRRAVALHDGPRDEEGRPI